MDIEIEIVGKSSKWVLNQPLIRIGRGAKCEVGIPAKQYPTVGMEHVALDVSRETVRLAGGAQSETYLNGRPAAAGTAVQSGDILRLGMGGPELRIRFPEGGAHPAPVGHEPTRLMQAGESPAYEPTRVVSVPGKTPDPAPWTPQAGAGGKKAPAYQGGQSPSGTVEVPYSPHTSPAGAASGGGAKAEDWRDRGQDRWKQDVRRPAPPAAAQAAAKAGAGGEEMRSLEGKLKVLQYILLANLAVMVVLLFWVFQLNRQLSENRDEIRELRMQAQSAVGQFTPALDAKLGAFEKRMNGLDDQLRAGEARMESGMAAKMKLAQDQMFDSLDAKMKATEERMVNRMNTEIPSMLDKYINKKLTEIKH